MPWQKKKFCHKREDRYNSVPLVPSVKEHRTWGSQLRESSKGRQEMFAAELRFTGKYWEYWSEGCKGYVSDQRTLWWQADMMNGVIVIKEHRKQYKSVEKQGLVSLVSLLMEQTLTKLHFFIFFLFPVPPFQLLIFSCCFNGGYGKASPTSKKTAENLLKKTLNCHTWA